MIRRALTIATSLWLTGPALAQMVPGAGGPMEPIGPSIAGFALPTIYTINPLDYFAVCDGSPHALSERFPSIAVAQAAYGSLVTITSLSQDLDTVAFQAAMNTGHLAGFPSGKTCTLRTRLSVPTGSGIAGDGTGGFVANGVDFPATSLASNATDTIILADTVSKFQIYGFKITFTTGVNSFTRAIVARASSTFDVNSVELTGFNAGNLIELDSNTNCKAHDNYIHDSLLDRTGSTSQLTGIAVDDNKVSSVSSDHCRIYRNRIADLTVTPAFFALFAYQSDGITVLPGSTNMSVTTNDISDVGECIDYQADRALIGNNTLYNCHQYGIKLIHGASYNDVPDNVVLCSGIGGITTFGAAIDKKPTVGNNITGGVVGDGDCNLEYTGSTTWAIGTKDSTGGAVLVASDNHFSNVRLIGGSHTSYAMYFQGNGTGNRMDYTSYTSDYTFNAPDPPIGDIISVATAAFPTPSYIGISAGNINGGGTLNLTANGTTLAGAPVLLSETTVIPTCPANNGVRLLGGVGEVRSILNKGANACNIYPAKSINGKIDALATNAPYVLASGSHVTISCPTLLQCYSSP